MEYKDYKKDFSGASLNFNGFKAYDIRGKIGEEISEELCIFVARALVKHLGAKKVCLGCDNRLTSQGFKEALANGFQSCGVDVIDIGLTGTEEVYFCTSFYNCDAGIQVTASHNPKDYNGLKIVSKGSVPMGFDTGLSALIDLIKEDNLNIEPERKKLGSVTQLFQRREYYNKLKDFFSEEKFAAGRKLKVLFNIGNGTAGSLTSFICNKLLVADANFEFVFMNQESDGNFPNGIPNPLLVENREATAKAVVEKGCDLGVAFDGDFDRCFFFDEKGNFIEGYYVCALLAEAFLKRNPGATICYEPRLLWNTKATIDKNGGKAVLTKSGHSFIKTKMREVDALYGGEMSAHHYFKDFYFCDSGMIPWLLVLGLLQECNSPMSELVAQMRREFPCSDELNFRIDNKEAVFAAIENQYASLEKEVSTLDGLSYDFGNWRFNVRTSNTEPLIRLNIETRADEKLLAEKITELTNLVKNA